MWGCNDESIVSIAAALHVALSCPNTRYLDLDGSLDLARDLVSGGFIIKDGVMSITGESGLGVKRVVSRLES
jgi:L-alanine-DL-glutamate epimerase-like enolase superfamily enzyme